MFISGTEWVRADFHLHTRADKEFSYTGEDENYINDYVRKLKRENIKLGVITNHNKFNFDEFKGLRNRARKEGITLLPGVELSVKEGSNGIHCLVVFKETWVQRKSETINQFLDEVFKGVENRDHANVTCDKDLIGTIECLDSFNKDYFILMAHVEQRSGFYKEIKGGLITRLSSTKEFKDKVLGFQKVRTEKAKDLLEQWMGYKLAHIEGSDCKSIEEIGKGRKSYIKIGEANFDSVVLAFKDYKNRVSPFPKEYNHGHIKSIKFIGGKMNDRKVDFSPELNCLIGIRGSGKSTTLESIRYGLDLPTAEFDKDYKSNLVDNLLESGGQVVIEIQDNHKNFYKIKRTLRKGPRIYNEEGEELEITTNSLLHTPLYFGQKDLSNTHEGYELNLLNRLMGEEIQSYREKLNIVNEKLKNEFRELLSINDKVEEIAELDSKLKDIGHKIKMFEEEGVTQKLSKQINFQKDERIIRRIKELISEFNYEINDLLNSDNLSELQKYKEITSNEVPDIFSKISQEITKISSIQTEIEAIREKSNYSLERVNNHLIEITEIIKSLDDEFAEIKREIDIPNLNPDDLEKLKKEEDRVKTSIDEIRREDDQKEVIKKRITELLTQRENILLEEYKFYKKKIENINRNQPALKLSINYKGNKKQFIYNLKKHFRGTNINHSSYEKISKYYNDFLDLIVDVLLKDSEAISEFLTEKQLLNLKENVKGNYVELLDIRTDNDIKIKYHGKTLDKHSIGQRASALVLFILSQKDSNLIVIDQPEDDLDNQVIYNEIIKKIRERKQEVQLIFATHNANIPVLGDSEQVIVTSYNDKEINIKTGSIDSKDIQNKIVDIMEGGQEAFNKRTQIYNLWKKK